MLILILAIFSSSEIKPFTITSVHMLSLNYCYHDVFSLYFYFKPSFFILKVGSSGQHIVEPCLFYSMWQSLPLYWVFTPFTINVIIDIVGAYQEIYYLAIYFLFYLCSHSPPFSSFAQINWILINSMYFCSCCWLISYNTPLGGRGKDYLSYTIHLLTYCRFPSSDITPLHV